MDRSWYRTVYGKVICKVLICAWVVYVLPTHNTFYGHVIALTDFRSVNTVYLYLCVCGVTALRPVELAVIELPVH
jgi:hypothetical protein